MKRLWPIAALGVLAAAVLLRPGSSVPEGFELATAEVLVLQDRLLERGLLTPLASAPVPVASSGDLVEIAKTGTRVEAGDPVIRVDPDDLQRNIESIELGLLSARTDLDSNLANLELVKLREANNLTKQTLAYDVAKAKERDAKIALSEEDRRLLEIDLRIAELALKDAEDQQTRQQSLFEKGFVSKTQLEPFQRRVTSAEARLKELQSTLALREQGRPAEEIVEFEREVKRLEAVLARGERAMARRILLVSNQIAAASARIERDEERLAHEQEGLDATTSYAPTSGVFVVRLYRDWRGGGGWQEYKPGRSVGRMDMIGDIVNPGTMNVDFLVHESDISRVEIGAEVRVSIRALDGQSFAGRVVSMGGLGRDRYELAPRGQEEDRTGVTVFNVRAEVRAEDAEFAPGMSAQVEVLLGTPIEILAVPRDAVRLDTDSPPRDGLHAASVVLEDGRRVSIRGAFRGPLHFVVHEGLEAGARVRVPRPEDAV